MVKELAAKHPDKPIVAWSFGDEYQSYEKKFEEDGNVAYFHSVNRAARALSALYRYHHEIKNAPPHVPTYTAPSQDQTSPVLAGKGAGNLSQTDVFDLLASYNIPVASWAQGATIEEGAAAAERIGYPVVMKVLSRDIVHKTDSGGVKLNIRNSQELHLAYEEMVAGITANHPSAVIEGIIIQEFISGGTEILLGSKRDPQFGPVIVFGTGGIYTEIMEDIALRVPPVSKEDIAEMIRETKVSKILLGARGAKPADMAALTEHIANFARLLLDNPSIAELDINPFVAIGDRFVALDGRVRVG